jgi:formylglycine-generating enzyme
MAMPSNDAEPIHRVRVDGFWMDETVVTNEQFAKFVAATGYVTIAERTPTKEKFPDALEANLVAGAVVLRRLITKFLSTITFSGAPT